MTELSDDLLVAYVDGQLARKQNRAVEKVLVQDDVISRRVDALKDAHTRLEAAFEAILAGEEADVSINPAPRSGGLWIEWRAVRIGLAGLGLCAALCLVVAGYGWPLAVPEFLRQPETDRVASQPTASQPEDGWADVVRAHALLSRATLEVGLESQANRDFIAFQLVQAIGANVKLADLQPQGYRFVRAELLRLGEQPLAQILYLGDTGAPLALYAKIGAGEEAPSFASHGQTGSVSWSEGGIAYLLAGEADEATLLRLCEKIRNEPEPPMPPAPSPPYSPLPRPL
jgi:anti-sigma factor RsiW